MLSAHTSGPSDSAPGPPTAAAAAGAHMPWEHCLQQFVLLLQQPLQPLVSLLPAAHVHSTQQQRHAAAPAAARAVAASAAAASAAAARAAAVNATAARAAAVSAAAAST